MENNKKIIAYTDGGARGNPGPAAIGVVVEMPAPVGKKHYSESIGETTNNVAEYKALIFALKKVKSLLGGDEAKKTEIEIRSDSELIVSQLKGEYRIKNEELIPLFIEAWNRKQDFKHVDFVLIPREENKAADRLVNAELDTLF